MAAAAMTDPLQPDDLQPRGWAPDINMMADQLIDGYREDPEDFSGEGFLDALNTILSWQETAAFHGDEFTEGDFIKLVTVLARRCANQYAEAEEEQ